MKKHRLLLLTLCLVSNIFLAQTGNTTATDNHIPNIIPPTPTVASLMKFEEVPVNKYTGIPDVSIPLINISGDLGMDVNLSMKYHPLSIKKDEIAGYTGLGWSLFAGGTISRTVRDIPDEYFSGENSAQKKIGIYDSRNNYYDVMPLLNDTFTYDHTSPEINKFFYEVSEKQKFDSKHDLYQYNFMGYSGRFIIEKTGSNYHIVKLSKDNLKITYNNTGKTFEVIDEKGLKYIFDIKEFSTSYSFTENIPFKGISNISGNTGYHYISSFHLSKVFNQDILLAEFLYNEDNEIFIEKQMTTNSTHNLPLNPSLSMYLDAYQTIDCNSMPLSLLPLNTNHSNTVETKTKKIKKIKITNKSIIDFITLTGDRLDQNVLVNANTPYLSEISIRDWNNRLIKSFNFEYSFIQKLFLKNITEISGNNEISKYSFSYKNNTLSPSSLKTDYWGYYKELGSYCDNLVINNYLTDNRDVDKNYVTKDVLTQIVYPTKGAAVFEYEPNTYSYIGDVALGAPNPLDGSIDYFEYNNDNWNTSQVNDILLNSSMGNEQVFDLGYFTTNRILSFVSFIANNEGIAGSLRLFKKNNSNQTVQTLILKTDCPLELNLEGGYQYSVGFRWDHLGQIGENPIPNPPVTGNAQVIVSEKIKKATINQWLYGGGIRIKNIYYINNASTLTLAEIQNQGYPNDFSKRISFDYNFFDNNTRSSGSLVYPKPLLNYEITRKYKISSQPCSLDQYMIGNIIYAVSSRLNNLSAVSTQGADVGYKNVRVSESGNGKTEYTYTSPIDYPESFGYAAVAYPFAPTKNIDYKRGLLLAEKNYNNSGRLLTSNENIYDFENYEKITGATLYYSNTDCPAAGDYLDYNIYATLMSSAQCNNGTFPLCFNAQSCGAPTNFISYHLNKEAFGWSKLMSTISKNYFYNGSTLHSTKEATNTYMYHTSNMQPVKQTTIIDGKTTETIYQYAQEKNNLLMIDRNMISTPLETTIKQTQNGVTKTLAKTETVYPKTVGEITNNGANLIVPSSILSFDLQNNSSTEITYDHYDSKGNLQQYTTKDGLSTAIIWGYNQTQPIAKVTGATYAQINSLASAIIAASDLDASNPANEPALITALDAFRKDATLSGYQITTFTYDPLIGVTTLTPPSGIREIYKYDSANRLEKIVDEEGKILKEFKYNYKP